MAKIRISAYTDKLSVKPGETITVMASADATDAVHASLVRLIHGDENPAGPGFVEEKIASDIERDWPARKQYVQKGNFLTVPDADKVLAVDGAFTLHAFIFPTPAQRRTSDRSRALVDRRHDRLRAGYQCGGPSGILDRKRSHGRFGGGGSATGRARSGTSWPPASIPSLALLRSIRSL